MVCSAPQLELNEDEAEEERSYAARSHDKRFSGRICHMCVVRAVEREEVTRVQNAVFPVIVPGREFGRARR